MVMADEGNEMGVGRMDLNLYLGRPRSPRPRTSDLGSDLALSSLPLSTSSTTDESRVPLDTSGALELEPTGSHAPYFPSHASFDPEPSIPPINDNPNQEHIPYSASYEPYDPTSTFMPQSDEPNASESPLPTLQETEEPVENHVPCPPSYTPSYVTESPSYIPLDTQETNDALFRPYIPSMYAPPMPSYVHRSPSYSSPPPTYSPRSLPPFTPQGAESLARDDESLARDDGSSSRRDLFESPEFRFRRLIESSHRLRLRRFRTSLPYHGVERSGSAVGRAASPVSDQQLMCDIMCSQRSLETNGKHKIHAEGIAAESSEEEKEDKNKSAANFECNICLDMSQEPVVTSCGHLFCWPCLYQWLNVHSEHKECPVCKGEVTEANITPIYGRGSSEASEGKTLAEDGESDLKIPPRPCGNRLESFRQQFRPISRRFGEGIATSWRRLMNQQMRSRNRFEGHGDPTMPGMLDGGHGHHAVLTRLRARRLLREGLNAEVGPEAGDSRLPRENTSTPQSSNTNPPFDDGIDLWQRPILPQSTDTSPLFGDGTEYWHRPRESLITPRSRDTRPLFRDGIDLWHRPRDNTTMMPRISETDRAELWHRVSMYGLYATDDIRRAVGNGNRYGASSSSVNPPSPEQLISRGNVASASAADQVSASSTTAVIQGDVGLPEGLVEPNSAGSSRSHRRRGRNGASSSLDVDGGSLHASKLFTDKEKNYKILRLLTSQWQLKITVIEEAHDLFTLKFAVFIGRLCTLEMNLMDKKQKDVAPVEKKKTI